MVYSYSWIVIIKWCTPIEMALTLAIDITLTLAIVGWFPF